MVRKPYFLAASTTLLCIVFVGCKTLMAILPSFDDGLAALLAELDNTLTSYEDRAIADSNDPVEALALQAIQSARKALIMRIIDSLASEYPEIDTSPYLERLNTATATAPDV